MMDIIFACDGYEMLRLCGNGDIFVKTIKVSRHKKTVEAFQEWLAKANQTIGGSIVKCETIASNEVSKYERRTNE
jgi:hypothetical protein